MEPASQSREVAGRLVVVSHPTKVFWPDEGITREQMLRYYETMAPFMLPHLKDRPVTLRVFPDGIQGPSYYRRDAPGRAPPWLRSIDYQPATSAASIQLPLIDDTAGLLWMAAAGATEFHLWASRAPHLAEPDMAIFDLDPGDQARFSEVRQAALRLHDLLEQLGLRACAKTSGGRGLHVYLPLAQGYSFEAVRSWVRSVAERLATEHPDLIAVAHGATHQGTEVTVDHAQNSMGRNTAGVHTLRARPSAPVSTPLTWEEIEAGRIRPDDWTLRTIPHRAMQMGDLFAPVLQGAQSLPK